MNAQVRFYISSSPSPSTSHQSASPSRVTSPENGVLSRTRVQRIVTRVGLESESRTRVLHHWHVHCIFLIIDVETMLRLLFEEVVFNPGPYHELINLLKVPDHLCAAFDRPDLQESGARPWSCFSQMEQEPF